MKKTTFILALALGVSAWSAMAQDQRGAPPAADDPSPAKLGSRDGPVGPGGPTARGFHVLPPWAMQELNLTDAQKKQLTDLEAELKAKVEKILTPEQLKKMKQMRPSLRQGGPGMGGQRWGGPPQRGQGWGGPPPGPPRMDGPGSRDPAGGPPPGGPGRPRGDVPPPPPADE